MRSLRAYGRSLLDPQLAPTAIKVALTVGSILLIINHGAAIVNQSMSGDRWAAALFTYIVPYMVNIHGQYISRDRPKT
ncbi:MAG: nitrate/nitrite transporter NrtS [Cyanobacteriota bacterium]